MQSTQLICMLIRYKAKYYFSKQQNYEVPQNIFTWRQYSTKVAYLYMVYTADRQYDNTSLYAEQQEFIIMCMMSGLW